MESRPFSYTFKEVCGVCNKGGEGRWTLVDMTTVRILEKEHLKLKAICMDCDAPTTVILP